MGLSSSNLKSTNPLSSYIKSFTWIRSYKSGKSQIVTLRRFGLPVWLLMMIKEITSSDNFTRVDIFSDLRAIIEVSSYN